VWARRITAPKGDDVSRSTRARKHEWRGAMRAMFLTYLLLIVLGLAYFTVIGLTHH
jgi:hypothetical protein